MTQDFRPAARQSRADRADRKVPQTLPACADHPAATSGSVSGAGQPCALQSVLIIEDDESLGYLLDFVLEREGYRVVWIQDGVEAATYIHEHAPPSVVLLDVNLPGMDGHRLLDLVRAHPRWGRTPVLMLTALSQAKDVAKAKDGGANDYVLKPFKPLDLVSRVAKLCQAVSPGLASREAFARPPVEGPPASPKPRIYTRRSSF